MHEHTPRTSEFERQLGIRILPRFLITFLPIILFLALGSFIFYAIEKNALEKIIQNQEVVSLDKQESLILSDFHSIISDLLYLATQAGNHTHRVEHGVIADPDLSDELVEFTRYKRIYDQVRLLDINGNEIIRVNNNAGRPAIVPAGQLQFKGERYYFTDTIGLGRGEVFVSPFDLNIENGRIEEPLKPMIRFGTPVFDPHGVKLGAIVLNYLGSQLNNKLREVSNTVSGSNMLLNPEGYWIISPNREDEWGFMYPDRKERTYRHQHPEIWRQLIDKRAGQFYNSGNLFTFNTIFPIEKQIKSSTGSSTANTPSSRPIDSSGYFWILVSEIPKALFAERLKLFAAKIFLVDGLLLVVFGIASWLVASARANRDLLFNEKQILIDELQDALANIQTLKGFIPICSSCKSIRDDTGYWNRIESYIADRSEAEFSHSICPKCSKRLYPDLHEDEDHE